MIVQLFTTAWETYKRHVPTFLGLCILYVVIAGAGQALIGALFPAAEVSDPFDFTAILTSRYSSPGGLLGLLWSAVSFVFEVGLLWAALKAVRGIEPEIGDLFSQVPRFVQAALLSILITVATAVGFVLFVIPGFYVALGLMLAPFVFADQGLDAVDSMRASWELMNGHRWEGLGLSIAIGAAFAAGAIACLVGLLVAAPVGVMAAAAYYDRLRAMAQPAAPEILMA